MRAVIGRGWVSARVVDEPSPERQRAGHGAPRRTPRLRLGLGLPDSARGLNCHARIERLDGEVCLKARVPSHTIVNEASVGV